MADYYPVLSRAIAGLDHGTPENRREVYERARKALVNQLRDFQPPLSESDITRERLALEDAVRRLEAEARPQPAPTHGASSITPPVPPRPPRPQPPAASASAAPAMPPAAPTKTMPAAERPKTTAGSAESRPQPIAAPPSPPRSDPPVYGPPSPGGRSRDFSAPELRRSRWPAIAAGIVVLVVAAIGGGAYVARDQLSDMLAATPTSGKTDGTTATSAPPKIVERIGAGNATDNGTPTASLNPAPTVPTTTVPGTTVVAPTVPAATGNVTQPGNTTGPVAPAAARAILYEETADRQSGSAFSGTTSWSVDKASVGGSHGPQTALQADVTIPGRDVHLKMTIKRNLDETLPASHTIDLQFQLPKDFPNGGIANVPGILFKPTEEAGGEALAALSVRVMNNFFLIGLSNSSAEEGRNLASMRTNGWIDLPILYENGRRAVLTLQKGAQGSAAFEQALAAWQQEAATAANATPPAGGSTSGPGNQAPAAPTH